jgi:hypothetical protein
MNNNFGEKMIKRFLIISIMMMAAIACSEEAITESSNELVVVTGFLRAGETNAEIKLTNTLALGSTDTISAAINDAEVILLKGSKAYQLNIASSLNGTYSYQGNDLLIESGDLFSLQINYKNRNITASTTVPSKPRDISISKTTLALASTGYGMGSVQDTTSIFLRWSNPDSSLYYVVIQNLETNPVAINSANTQRGANRTMVFPPMSTNQFLIGRRNLTYLGNHRAIVYKVNQEYADLYESRTQDSRNLNEPISNISNGLGVFSAFASDTTMFYVKIQ